LDLQQVRWIRVLYLDFAKFTEDQEMLISAEKTFDYIEGFAIINKTGILTNWRSSFNPQDPVRASQFKTDKKVLFCLEMSKNFNPEEADIMEQVRQQFSLELLNRFMRYHISWLNYIFIHVYRKSMHYYLNLDTHLPPYSTQMSLTWSSWIGCTHLS
jgi:hypothetical protein